MFKKNKPQNTTHTTISAEMMDYFPGSPRSPSGDQNCSSSRPLSPGKGTSFEIFRNHTTAVEVMVKDIHQNSNKRNRSKSPMETENYKIQKLQKEIENLKIDLNKANNKLVVSRKGFNKLVTALYRQLNTVSKREMEQQSQNVLLQLENEKLKTLLEAKSSLVKKLKNEIVSIKRMLKFLVKGMRNIPMKPDSPAGTQDLDYDDFEKGLIDGYPTFASNTYEGLFGTTFNSTASKHNDKK